MEHPERESARMKGAVCSELVWVPLLFPCCSPVKELPAPECPWPCQGPVPQVQLQLCVQEVQEGPPGHDLGVTVVDHQPLVADVLATDALGARGQDDDLCLPGVQA